MPHIIFIKIKLEEIYDNCNFVRDIPNLPDAKNNKKQQETKLMTQVDPFAKLDKQK